MSYCIYLTHPEVRIDPNTPVTAWSLSPAGLNRARTAATLPFAAEIKHVISSAERKAVETAHAFAQPHGLGVLKLQPLHENNRSSTGYLPPEEFEQVADQFFADPNTSIRGWERAFDAQNRIVSGVTAALSRIPADAPVLFAGHGGVGTLLMCHLMNVPISRKYDQKRGGCWYRFDKSDLTARRARELRWTEI